MYRKAKALQRRKAADRAEWRAFIGKQPQKTKRASWGI